MLYRTRTYIAADWDNDHDVVDKLLEWNDSDDCELSFSYAHDLMQARDDSLCCSIKHSLHMRMNGSDLFVLIVSPNTTLTTKGGCQYCGSYNSHTKACGRGYNVDYRSYLNFECEQAAKLCSEGKIKIVVIHKDVCLHPEWLCDELKQGTSAKQGIINIPAYYSTATGDLFWNKQAIIDALMTNC